MLIARILEGSGSAASNASEYSWCILEGHSAARSHYFIFLFSSLPSSFHYSFSSFFPSSTFIWSFLSSVSNLPPSLFTPILLFEHLCSSLCHLLSLHLLLLPLHFVAFITFFLHLSAFRHLLFFLFCLYFFSLF